MNNSRINHITERYYDNLELSLHNIVPGFDAETIHSFRLTYKNLRAFIRMLGEEAGDKSKLKISRNLRKTYRLLGQIRNLDLQKLKITGNENSNYSSLQHYLTILGDKSNRIKQKLSEVLSKEPLRKSKRNILACLPTDFSIVNFQIYAQVKIAAIISIVETDHIRDESIHTIRKVLNDLYYNHKKYEEDHLGVVIAPIFEGKDDTYSLKLLEEFGVYHDMCTSLRMIENGRIKDLISSERETIKTIRKGWLNEKRTMKDALVKKFKTEIRSINTYHEYDAEASNFA